VFFQVQLVYMLASMNVVKPAASYRETGWVWEITGWNSRLQGELPNSSDKFVEYTSNFIKKNRKISACNGLDLKTVGSWRIKNLPRPVIREIFKHNWLRSYCLQVQPVTCWHPSLFLY
jgi:hypothetical protein